MLEEFVRWIRAYYQRPEGVIHLHETFITDNEHNYIKDCLNSRIVSSIGSYVESLEQRICEFTGAPHAVAMVNGTSALHLALLLCGIQPGDLIITQPFTFVATGNAIRYASADPVFVDIDRQTLGMSPHALADFLERQTIRQSNGFRYHKSSGRRIGACLPVHAFGHPVDMEGIMKICSAFQLPVIEDAAEALGSWHQQQHVGTWGMVGVFSFNGNKVVTSGGGGMLVTQDPDLASAALHLSRQAGTKENYSYWYDAVGYNYRMPNINAALGCAQMENLKIRLQKRKELTDAYQLFFAPYKLPVWQSPPQGVSNYWMQALRFPTEKERNKFVQYTNEQGIHTRPAWRLLSRFPMFANCYTGSLENAEFIEKHVACLPSVIQ